MLCFFTFTCAAMANTVYNNFGPGNEGFEYATGESWMIAGNNSYFNYVEQAHAFVPIESGYLSDIYIGLMEVLGVNECTVRLVPDNGDPPSEADTLETWLLHADDLPSGGGGEPRPATQLVSAVMPYLTAGQSYWIWVKVDSGSSASWGENVTGATGRMKEFVWVDEHYQYEWVDIANGYAKGAMRVDIFDGTPAPTATPTATDTPTITPTPTSTPTATPTGPTPTPTATPLVDTAYNNFGTGNEGFEYATDVSWMIAGNNSYFNYVEQAHAFTPSESGPLAYIYIGLMEVLGVNECTVRLVPDNGDPPLEADTLETWLLHDGDLPSGGGGEPRPATQLVSVDQPYLTAGQRYWIWIQVDSGSSASWGENVTGATGRIKEFVWVDEHYQYEWVDIAYGYALGAMRIDIIQGSQPTGTPTEQASPTNTPPTATPTEHASPTDTPIPPTATPIPPTDTPILPTNTPILPTATAIPPTETPIPPTDTPIPPSPTPGCDVLGVKIWMPADLFTPGEPCACKAMVCNIEENTLSGYPLFIILDVAGRYYFAPKFNEFGFYERDYPIGETAVEVLPEFLWPSGVGSASGITWYGALTNPEMTEIYGKMDTFVFGWDE